MQMLHSVLHWRMTHRVSSKEIVKVLLLIDIDMYQLTLTCFVSFSEQLFVDVILSRRAKYLMFIMVRYAWQGRIFVKIPWTMTKERRHWLTNDVNMYCLHSLLILGFLINYICLLECTIELPQRPSHNFNFHLLSLFTPKNRTFQFYHKKTHNNIFIVPCNNIHIYGRRHTISS